MLTCKDSSFLWIMERYDCLSSFLLYKHHIYFTLIFSSLRNTTYSGCIFNTVSDLFTYCSTHTIDFKPERREFSPFQTIIHSALTRSSRLVKMWISSSFNVSVLRLLFLLWVCPLYPLSVCLPPLQLKYSYFTLFNIFVWNYLS